MDDDFVRYYDLGLEAGRLVADGDAIELTRTCELLQESCPRRPPGCWTSGAGRASMRSA